MWHTFIRKPLKRYYDAAHGYGCKVMQHSCGSIRDIIPALIENGVDIIDPIQVAAEGMEFAGLVRDFGAKVCLHGGIDTQHILPFGSVADVRAAVRSHLELTRGGGYILAGSQGYIEDIPLDNILAVYDENLTHRSRATP
jgi:uroporphyrinogen decarboxylase